MVRRPLVLLSLAALSAAAALTVWAAAFHVAVGRALDGGAMQAFAGVARPPLEPSIRGVAVLADPLPFALGAASLVAVALVRRRWLLAAVVPVVLLAANACTQLLKPGLAQLRIVEAAAVPYPASWPSGHATAAMSLALCLVLVAGPRLRPVAALVGAGYAVGVGYALVALGWHLPSDVLGGYLVAACFVLLGGAALTALERRGTVPPAREGRAVAPWPAAATGAAVAVLAAAALVASRPELPLVTVRHAAALLAAFGIAALAVALTAGLALVLRR